ncbi:hypothetical protein HF086_011915 [Spodoptera exigua]|uniref:PHD-type domain-containing protein n=1 Tax=Spodoptera exigua TaxID=7107 RepID=A0A922M943_SPOEX|nr:hypothetical protein HF086_011915 [Spodoptera exigua]
MFCLGCNQVIDMKNGFLQCKQCRNYYHYECLNIGHEQYSALSAQYRATWQCPSCNNITRRTRSNLNTPVRQAQVPTSDESMNMSFDSSPPPTHATVPSTKSNIVTMDNIRDLLDQRLNASMSTLMDKFRSILKEEVKKLVKTEIDSVVQQLKNEFTMTTDYICADVADLKSEMKNTRACVKTLEAENTRLLKEINSLNSRLSSSEKLTRSLNLEIQAVPERKNENILAMFKSLCKSVNTEIKDDQIISCRRVAKLDPKKDRPRNILVTLSNSRLRDQLKYD